MKKTNPNMPGYRGLKASETNRVEEGADPKPDHVVQTGLEASDGATSLEIFYHEGNTIVVPCGEVFNADAWAFDGIFQPGDVLQEYLQEMQNPCGDET